MNWKILATVSGIYTVYVILGGVIFHFIETPQEETTRVDVSSFRQRFLSNFTCVSSDELDALLGRVIRAYDAGVIVTNSSSSASNWDVASSIFFSVTVVTTIGYGNISPSTVGGQAFCIVYALVGIPLTLVMLAGIGEKLTARMAALGRLRCCQGREKTWRTVRSVSFIVGGVVVLMIVPASVFTAVEGWDWGSAFYYTFITLSTIGFGDYVADGSSTGGARPLYRLLVGVWIVVGLAWLSTIISMLQEMVAKRVEKEDNRRFGSKDPLDKSVELERQESSVTKSSHKVDAEQ